LKKKEANIEKHRGNMYIISEVVISLSIGSHRQTEEWSILPGMP